MHVHHATFDRTGHEAGVGYGDALVASVLAEPLQPQGKELRGDGVFGQVVGDKALPKQDDGPGEPSLPEPPHQREGFHRRTSVEAGEPLPGHCRSLCSTTSSGGAVTAR